MIQEENKKYKKRLNNTLYKNNIGDLKLNERKRH